MSSLRGAYPLIFLVLAGAAAWAGEPLGSPAEGVLVLRNGQALAGQVERIGDNYIVHLSGRAKLHVPVNEVDLHCPSLECAYQKKREYLDPKNAGQHLDLAEWCLRNGLERRAAEQLSAAIAAEPDEPRIEQVERRLRDALVSKTAKPPAAKTTAPAKPEDLEEAMRSVSAAAVERFTSAVQPVLLNRCATSSCHGTTSKSSFKLLRPTAGDPVTRRYTQRNLQAVLRTIDKAAPEASRFLTAPCGPHGTASTAVFGQRDERQFEQLVEWVKQVAEPKGQQDTDLATLDKRPPPPSLPPRTSLKPPAPQTPGNSRPLGAKPGHSKPTAPPANAPDPFDPELFNKKFVDRKEDTSK
jgi:hypothetical protein